MSESGKSSLLIDESPLVFQPSLACRVGVTEAIVLQQVQYWIRNFEKSKDQRHFIDGRYWVWNSYKNWRESAFPFWSEKVIRRAIGRLESMGVLLSRQPNKGGWDVTKWYSIDYEALDRLTDQVIDDVDDEVDESTDAAEKAVELLFGGGDGAVVKNPRARKALIGGLRDREKNKEAFDLSDYPEDVRAVIGRFCDLWKISPPVKGKNGKGGDYALWISDARSLERAAGEFGISAIDAVYNDWIAAARENNGVEPFTVSRPGAIIKKMVSKISVMRANGNGNGKSVPTVDEREAARERVRRAKEVRDVVGFSDHFDGMSTA